MQNKPARMNEFLGRQWHDMGGQDSGPVAGDEHEYAFWEKRVDALMVIASRKGLFTVDQLRRVLEEMGENAFETMSYYERWIFAVNRVLVETGVYSTEELAAKLSEVRERGSTYGECCQAEPR